MNFIKKGLFILMLIVASQGLRAQESKATTSTPNDEEKVVSLTVTQSFVNTPIHKAAETISKMTGKTITLGKNVAGSVTTSVRNLFWKDAVRAIAKKVGAFVVDHGQDWVEIVKPPLVTFSTDPQGTDIRAVLDAIAVNYGFNLVMSNAVSGTVHIRLNRVPWRKAVEVAVKAAGNFAVVEEDYDILRIVPTADLANQLQTRVFPLKYITSPSDVQATMSSSYASISTPTSNFTLQQALGQVITPSTGFLEFDADNRAFIVKDTPPVLKEVENIIKMLDIPRKQVVVEVYVVSTTNTNFVDFGVDWGAAGPVVEIAGGKMFHRLPFQIGRGGFEDAIGIPSQNPVGHEGVTGGVPSVESANRFGIPNATDFQAGASAFTAGELDFTAVKAVLNFVETDTDSKVVRSPKLAVLDNQRATIFSGEEIRYAQSANVSGQDGGTNIVFSEAANSPVNVGFQLFITPHVVPGTDKIILDLIPQSDILTGTTSGLTGFETFGTGTDAIDLPRISSQTVVTQVMVESGKTAMVGGLVSYNNTRTDFRLPYLGEIPFLDFLFRNKSHTKSISNLTIFIRPTITLDDKETRQALFDDLKRREEKALKDFRLRFDNSDKK